MSASCDLCMRKNFIRVTDLSPTCNGCANLREVLQPYLGSYVITPRKEHHGSPRYAITLSGGFLEWKNLDVTLTLTAIPDKKNSWDLEITDGGKLNDNASLDRDDPILNLGETTQSLITKELVQRWLQECRQHHRASCWRKYQAIPSESYPPLPYRVLQFGRNLSNTIKLCEDIKDNAPYVCLSYCWGKEEDRILTTSGNKEKHKAGILFKELLPLFQQSIDLALYLGIGYIWIDALCIIQNDEEDWKNEAKKMAQIYSNSWLTIAATAASGPRDNLFRKRSLKTIQSTEASFLVQATRHFPNLPRNDTEAMFPLLKRGWVYQERLLSPRVIHFGPDESMWECFQKRRCECGQNSHLLDEINKSKFTKFSDGLGSKHDSRLVGDFRRGIVVQYTSLTLTKPNDRLYVLHGILNTIGSARRKASKDVYLAGLWQETLAFDLLWHVYHGRRKTGGRTQAQLERAPTWSWASVDGDIEYPQSLYCSPDIEVEEICQVIVKNKDSTDALSSEPIGPTLIKLECHSFKRTVNKFGHISHGIIFYDDSVPCNEELHFCLVAQEGPHRYFYALVLRAHGQVFSRVGFAMFKERDALWPKETFIIR